MKGNLLWDALQNPSRRYERELRNLKLCAEEVLLECLTVMDEVKESPKEASFRMQSLWDSVFCDLRDLDLGDADERELELGTSVIVYSVILVMSMCQGTYYTKLVMSLMEQICEHDEEEFERLQAEFLTNVWRMGEERLKAYVQEYMDSDEVWLSDELKEKLKDVPLMSVVVKADRNSAANETKKVGRLTNRQLVILFEQLLNVPLTSGLTNIKALAELLSKVSGNSAGSIRQRIMAGIDYDDEQVKKDVEKLATLIEPISATVAENLRNTIE